MAIETTTSVDVKTLTPFKRFIMTLGILPTSYLESMTYAELVMWFCNFLQNEVIPAVNNNAEAVKEIQDWINTLDLQDEVDNKLDEMAESGELAEIISEYLNSKAIFGYDTVADLTSAENLISGSYARTLGYYSINDGGGALYYITDQVVSNSEQISFNGLYATLLFEDKINVKQMGAYGDDSHDDTTIINKAITLSNALELPVYIPIGTYKTTNTLTFINDLYMDGIINYYGTTTGIILGDTLQRTSKKYFEINIKKNSETSNSIGLLCNNINNSTFNIKNVDGFYYGVEFKGSNSIGFVYNNITIGIITNYKEALIISNGNSGWCNENYFKGGRLFNPSAATYKNNEVAIRITSDQTYKNNNNNFDSFCLEGNNKAIIIDYGSYNRFNNLRTENVTTLIECKNDSEYNIVNVGYGTSTYSETRPNGISGSKEQLYNLYNKVVYDSGDIEQNCASNDTKLSAAHLYSMRTAGLVNYSYYSSFTNGVISLRNNAVVGAMIEFNDSDKTILIDTIVDPCRIAIFPYNTDDEFIDEAPTTAGGATFSKYTSNPNVNNLPYWRTGGNSSDNLLVKLPDTTKRAFIGIQSASQGSNIKSLRLLTRNMAKTHFIGLNNDIHPVLDTIPTSTGQEGQIVLSSDTTINGWIYKDSTWTEL